jgi:UDP-N-acetylmuramoylalanine--D-glutamate ligase
LQVSGKHILVIGTQRSGRAAIELLLRYRARVRAMDLQPAQAGVDVPVVPQEERYVRDESGEYPDAIVLSPAVPYDLDFLVRARNRGIPVIGEVELASSFLRGPVIGITGANGKTTTTALTGHLLRECGIDCQVGGNIGTAVASLIDSSSDGKWNVLELSSFQLESIHNFRATLAACLNVTPDHLDRHHTFEAYVAAKRRLFETQQANDKAVLNYDDAACRRYAEATRAQVYWFSFSSRPPCGVWLERDQVCLDGKPLFGRSEIKLRGLHNVENVMAASLLAYLAGAPPALLGAAVESFPGVEHRIEFVRTLDGVDYFNDSKATNVDAALKAIDAFPSGLWIILGGKDKGSDYRPLCEPLRRVARKALLIGAPPPYPYAAAPLIQEALAGCVETIECGELANAVQYARRHAVAGDTVLLAPACASFDQFRNYEERGQVFKNLVSQLT